MAHEELDLSERRRIEDLPKAKLPVSIVRPSTARSSAMPLLQTLKKSPVSMATMGWSRSAELPIAAPDGAS
ncbi:MAG: hypothetical protein HWE37_12225 [Rhodobacteraceae bacterium]|nr:hypothetical protein [Paracoccaceae bacterium]